MCKNCLKKEEIWDYIDGELEMSAYCRVRSHLEECPNCENKYQEIRSFNSSLVIGFDNELLDCNNRVESKSDSIGKCVTSPVYIQKWSGLWQRLILLNVAAFCSAFVIIVFFSPNIEGLFCISELSVLRQSVISLLHL